MTWCDGGTRSDCVYPSLLLVIKLQRFQGLAVITSRSHVPSSPTVAGECGSLIKCLVVHSLLFHLVSVSESHGDGSVKKARSESNEAEGRPAGKMTPRPSAQKSGPPLQAPAEHQPFFNRLYKAVAWKLVSAGGFGPNLDHFEILRSCVESCKQTLTCVFVPLKDITGLPTGRTQRDGHVCEIRCQTVYMGTGYGRDESAAKAMASKEALKVFQGRKVTVKICRRRYRGRDVEDLMLLDEQPRSQGFPPAISYPFQGEQLDASS